MKRGGLCADLDNLLIVKSQIKYLPAVKAVFKLINFSIFEFNEMIYRRRSNIFQFLFLRFRVIFVLYSNRYSPYTPHTSHCTLRSPKQILPLHAPHFALYIGESQTDTHPTRPTLLIVHWGVPNIPSVPPLYFSVLTIY